MPNETKTEGENDCVLKDNPCWGSPTNHGLEDLLSRIGHDTSIVYDSSHYVVLNKPPDLRMDGPYPATVHKLLTYWYPPLSLSGNNSGATSTGHDKSLLEAVSRLHQHNDVRDNFLRPCHQLDYATSGILLVAKTQEAAAHVGRLFEERHEGVQKSYMAILVGDVRTNLLSKTGDQKLHVWTGGSTTRHLREKLQLLEGSHRKMGVAAGKQHRRVRGGSKKEKHTQKGKKLSYAGGTFQGFQPVHSIFAKWKAKHKKSPSPEKKNKKRRKLNNQSASTLLTEEDWKRIWNPVDEAIREVSSQTNESIDYQTLEWKQLKIEHPFLTQAMTRATDLHNDILRNAIQTKEQQDLQEETNNCGLEEELPVLFRLLKIEDDEQKSENADAHTNDNEDTFYVCCPLAQHPSQFNMAIPPSIAKDYPHVGAASCEDGNESNLKFRPSLTKCTILERGTLSAGQGAAETKIPVTKVRLHPITGRRHQLRVHMALAGFPILGDAAYGGLRDKDEGSDNQGKKEEGNERHMDIDICSRMCLHAQSLQLPTLVGEKNPNWKVVTPDPFLFAADGKLQLK